MFLMQYISYYQAMRFFAPELRQNGKDARVLKGLKSELKLFKLAF